MTPYTKGPWEVSPGYAQRGKWSGHLAIYARNGGVVTMQPKGPRDDVNAANARLIAAAPELFEALAAVADCEDGVISEAVHETVLAAIDKALGRVVERV